MTDEWPRALLPAEPRAHEEWLCPLFLLVSYRPNTLPPTIYHPSGDATQGSEELGVTGLTLYLRKVRSIQTFCINLFKATQMLVWEKKRKKGRKEARCVYLPSPWPKNVNDSFPRLNWADGIFTNPMHSPASGTGSLLRAASQKVGLSL